MTETPAHALTFEVSGLPPLKTSPTPLLAAGGRQAVRVRALLEAACLAAQETGWMPLTSPVGLEVVLRHPPDSHTGDVTHFLGGIGDVLRDKRRGAEVPLGHLGALLDVALFHDDRQIRQISYREEDSDEVSYRVRVERL
ncbi:hypothetical protein [Catenuloplanes japonicus]|uniref:hypothetical protein n=1 Tax=Catenuloplanes japonicus TaxID=33876 RepID=UPI0005244A7B|nr:hypothetical protein [Catenuloplanes japonicus]